jgi:hypothetical protein
MTAASQLIDPAYLSGHFVFAAFASAFLLKVSWHAFLSESIRNETSI